MPEAARGDLASSSDEAGKTHVEFLPLDMGALSGRRVRFHLYSAPSGLGSEADRVSLLSGADGIVFVADSQKDRFRDTCLSYREMEAIAGELGLDLAETPLVLQYNKRDARDAVPVPVLEAGLNGSARAYVEAVATTGVGVLATLRNIGKQVMEKLNRGGQ